VTPIGEGTDHLAYEACGLILRFAKHGYTARVRKEASLLVIVARHSAFPVPRATYDGDHLTYPKLPGIALIALPGCRSTELTRRLTCMLEALQAIPAREVAHLVERDDCPMASWLDEAAQNYALVEAEIPAHRTAARAFLATAPPAETSSFVFSHNDFGAEHLLADPATCAITGVIDWSDAALTDPACDFGRLYRDLGPGALEATPPALRARAAFYARCGVFEDLAYGLTRNESRYVNKCLASLSWLLPT
jgi:aminoglycoside phosphotransferase (APT) family kinase protein